MYSYVAWLEKLVTQSGGELAHDPLHYDILPTDVLVLRPQTIRFHDGSRLEFGFALDGEGRYLKYRFAFFTGDGRKLWRHDKHPNTPHSDGSGARDHVHHFNSKGHETWVECDEVWFDEVLAKIYEFHAGAWSSSATARHK